MAPADSTKSGTATASATPTLDLLCLLDSYDVAHGSGRTSQKAAQWKIGTARREKGGFHLGGSSTSISALNVREELRARAVVQVASSGADEPSLVDEGSSSSKIAEKGGEETDALFALHLDGIPKKDGEAVKSAAADDDATLSTAINSHDADLTRTTGLRQRKKNVPPSGQNARDKGDGNDEKDKWTEEIPSETNKLTPEELEEKKLLTANPLDLFGGLPPPSLRAAQVKAREALVKYVEAANVAAEIIRLTNEAEKRQKGGENA